MIEDNETLNAITIHRTTTTTPKGTTTTTHGIVFD